MKLEYGSITSVFKSDTLGAQLCHVKGNLTSAEYQNCEIITPGGVNYLPKIGDTVVVVEMYNAEIAVIGVLNQFDLGLEIGETMLHSGTVSQAQSSTYNLQAKVKLNIDGEIEIFKGNTTDGVFTPVQKILLSKDNDIELETLSSGGVSEAKIKLYSDGKLDIVNAGKTTIQSATEIDINAPIVKINGTII